MNDLDELTKKLFKNNNFTNQMKASFQRFYQEKHQKTKTDDFLRPVAQNQSLKLNERPFQQEELNMIDNRCSMSSSVFSKRQSRDSISSMSSNPFLNQYLNSNSSGTTLNQITNQITSILSEIIKKQCAVNTTKIGLPLAQQTNGISELIQKMSEVQKQQLTMLKQNMAEQIQSLKAQIQEQVVIVIEKLKEQRKNKKVLDKASQIKKQRRKVTQSILDISKNNHEMSTFSNIYDVGNILSDSQDQDNFQRKNSPQLSQLSQKLSEVQKSQSKISKEFEDKFLREVQQNAKDVQALTQRIIEWKMKNEEKLENGFTGVWNIVTDIQDKINKVIMRVGDLQQAFAIKRFG